MTISRAVAAPGWRGRVGRVWKVLGDNPVLTLSLRRGMRRGTTFGLQFAYILALTALTALIYSFVFSGRTPAAAASERMGRQLFLWIGLVQTFFLSLTASVLGGASISVEREQRTYEALQLTRLSPLEVLAGKYLSLMLLLSLLIATSIPIACLGFLFGGIAPVEVTRAAVITFVSTASALAVGVACSAFCSRSSMAIIAATSIAIGLLIGVPAIFAYLSSLSGNTGRGALYTMVVLNPLFAIVHLFEKAPGVPVHAADMNVLLLSGLGSVAWCAALARLRALARE